MLRHVLRESLSSFPTRTSIVLPVVPQTRERQLCRSARQAVSAASFVKKSVSSMRSMSLTTWQSLTMTSVRIAAHAQESAPEESFVNYLNRYFGTAFGVMNRIITVYKNSTAIRHGIYEFHAFFCSENKKGSTKGIPIHGTCRKHGDR